MPERWKLRLIRHFWRPKYFEELLKRLERIGDELYQYTNKLVFSFADIGIYKKAKEKKIWNLEVFDIREYAQDKHNTTDETPFGGGNGMLMRADVLASALDKNINFM